MLKKARHFKIRETCLSQYSADVNSSRLIRNLQYIGVHRYQGRFSDSGNGIIIRGSIKN